MAPDLLHQLLLPGGNKMDKERIMKEEDLSVRMLVSMSRQKDLDRRFSNMANIRIR